MWKQIIDILQFVVELGLGIYHAWLIKFCDPPKSEREEYEDSGWTMAGFVIISPIILVSYIMNLFDQKEK